ncbi:MAG: cation-transporting P-type ATPase [bacterium]|nr:cation-transporting P-type ATPase [bacterium]
MPQQRQQLTRAILNQPFWTLTPEETLTALTTSSEGLSTDEAAKRRAMFGENVLNEHARTPRLHVLLNQFRSPLILILIVAGVITAFLGERIETAAIFTAVVINAALGFYQENKAENALELLTAYVRTFTRVRRDGREVEIDASWLVPGDIIRIRQGDRIPADARLVFTNNLEVDESPLTGESLPIAKDPKPLHASASLPERTSMVFAGTLSVQGFADAIVVATDADTEFGKIARLVGGMEREETPLQLAIKTLARWISAAAVVLAVGLFALGISAGYGAAEMFVMTVAVAVSAVPEGLPIALTVVLAIGVQRLAAKKGVVRKLLAAETLGSTTLILTDKTGTLTQANMELVRVLPQDGAAASEHRLLRLALANTDVIVENPGDTPEEWKMFGRPLEVALTRGAAKRGVMPTHHKEAMRDRLPFTSERKFSAVLLAPAEGPSQLVFLGAPDILLRHTTLPEHERIALAEHINTLALNGERVLGVATRILEAEGDKRLSPSSFSATMLAHLTFEGLIAFRDPLRPTVKDAIRRVANAGVRTVIVTGDHRGTAEAVARELGLIEGSNAVLDGEDLQHLTPSELASRAKQISVYARVTPEQKMMLVQMYRRQGEVVAVTGDGINDAPALKEADIGVAVGSGTDVAKSAADLIILDDNFETIVAAIEEGRRIVENIRKIIVYFFSGILDELILVGGSFLAGFALPINALQILFINFISDSLPAVAFAFEHRADGTSAKPKNIRRHMFDKKIRFLILTTGVLTSLALFLLYAILLRLDVAEDVVRTFIFASFSTYTLFLAFALRSLEKSIFSYNPFSNHYLNIGVGVGIALTLAMLYIPAANGIFHTVPLPLPWLLGVFVVGLLNITAAELGKWLFRREG